MIVSKRVSRVCTNGQNDHKILKIWDIMGGAPIGVKNIRCTVILLKNIIYMTPPPLPRGGSYYELWW